MRPPESFIGQPIRSLQTMLRVISESDPRYPTVIPDGIYGQETMNAVSNFQRRKGLKITGVVDQNTWEAIVEEYESAIVLVDAAYPLEIVLNPNQIIRKGDNHPNVYLIQAILTVLSQAYPGIPEPSRNGFMDIPTTNSLSAFQEFSLLPATGELDKITWKHLALQYPMATNLLTNDLESFL